MVYTMMPSWAFHLCRGISHPDTAKRYTDAAIGILLVPLLQLLVVPLQIALDSCSFDLPASILVMAVVTIVMLLASCVHGGVYSFYVDHMKGPVSTSFLALCWAPVLMY